MLEKDNDNLGYLSGRAFAISIQANRKAYPTARTGVDRYSRAFIANPTQAYTQVDGLVQKYIQKMRRDYAKGANELEDRYLEIVARIPSSGFPARFSQSDQIQFVQGWKHQMVEEKKIDKAAWDKHNKKK